MANPARHLFHDEGALPAGWSWHPLAGITYAVEGPTGAGTFQTSANLGGPYPGFLSMAEVAYLTTTLVGDFDFLLVLELTQNSSGNPRVDTFLVPAPLVYPAGPSQAYGQLWYGETNSNTTTSYVRAAGDWYGFTNSPLRTSRDQRLPHERGAQVFRFSRYAGHTRVWHLRGGYLSPSGATTEGWVELAPHPASAFWAADPTVDLDLVVTPYSCGMRLWAILPLPLDGAGLFDLPDLPATLVGGAAASSPTAADADLGVAFRWDAAAANQARVAQVLTALDAGFTASVRQVTLDRLVAGEAVSFRRGGLGAGVAVWAKARLVDEVGQAGAWSATVTAAAALSPQASPTYAAPVVAVRAGEPVRIVRSPA